MMITMGKKRGGLAAARMAPAGRPNLPAGGWVLSCLLAGMLLWGSAGPAPALGGDETGSPQAIEKHIQELKVFYTDDHPEVLRYQRALQKAREAEARRQTEKMKAERRKQQEAAPVPGAGE